MFRIIARFFGRISRRRYDPFFADPAAIEDDYYRLQKRGS